jgi:diguanylate cyclase (GGDEF)-like protein/hemerythrin-like metal-binding protein
MEKSALWEVAHRTALDMVAVAAVDSSRKLVANAELHRLLGLDPGGERGSLLLVGPESDGVAAPLEELLVRALEGAGAGDAHVRFAGHRADGERLDLDIRGRRVDHRGSAALVAVAVDATDAGRSSAQLDRLAFFDSLTGLANRNLFGNRLSQALLLAARGGHAFTVMLADLDGFKQVNDRYGHAAGDALLRVVARRLRSCVRDTDTAARLGGDEFAVLLPELCAPADAASVASRLVAAVGEPVQLAQGVCTVGLSVGVAHYPGCGVDADSILASADAAMYAAKRAGKNQFVAAPERRSAFATTADGCLIAWDASHEVGIAAVDAQHAELAARLNRLASALQAGDAPSVLRGVLDDVEGWARLHFRTEERLMSVFGYSELAAHAREHCASLEGLSTFGAHDERGAAVTMVQLKDWFLRHIDDTDRPMADFLSAAGAR